MTSILPVAPVAGAAGRVAGALNTAKSAVGNVSVAVGSKLEASIAGNLWTAGGRAIRSMRGAGEVVGKIAGDRVYRFGQVKAAGVHAGEWVANLVNKATGGNVHLVLKRFQLF